MANITKSLIITLAAISILSCDRYIDTKRPFEKGVAAALARNTYEARKSFVNSIKSNINTNKSLIAIGVLKKLEDDRIDASSSYFFFSAITFSNISIA